MKQHLFPYLLLAAVILMLLPPPALAGPDLPRDAEVFPAGNPFRRLLADPKQPRFFVSFHRLDSDVETIHAAVVGYGENFGLIRYPGPAEGDGLQFNIDGALFAQFNLDAASNDLINADYTLGFPVTWRRGEISAKLRVYHQSSHLGDEFLLRTKTERINLSYEALELLGSWEPRPWRLYLGGEYLLHRDPPDLHRAMFHGGLEYYGPAVARGWGRFLAGLDLKSFQEHDWAVDAAFAAGVELARPAGRRAVRLLFEGYKGHSPYGQFYNDRISYVGFAVDLEL